MSESVRNVLKIVEGNRDKLSKYLLGNGISFQKIISMPKDLEIEECYDNLMSLRRYLNEHPELKGFEKWRGPSNEGDLEIGKQMVTNIVKYGHPTWYEWRLEHWGCKWDAKNVYKDKELLIFDTPNSTPKPIITALSKMFPNTTFEWYWAEEGNNFSGANKVKNGNFEELEINNLYEIIWNGGVNNEIRGL